MGSAQALSAKTNVSQYVRRFLPERGEKERRKSTRAELADRLFQNAATMQLSPVAGGGETVLNEPLSLGVSFDGGVAPLKSFKDAAWALTGSAFTPSAASCR